MSADIIDIQKFRSGVFIRQRGSYKSFQPNEINAQWIFADPAMLALLSAADRKLGELNAFAQLIPDVDFFINMHVSKEAVKSSRIEGTQTSIEEALMERDEIAPEKRDDWEEVQNYIQAMNNAIQWLDALPLSNRLLRQAHGILLQGVRGSHRQPGEFRHSQNWIGGLNLRDAVFVPPVPWRSPAPGASEAVRRMAGFK